MARMIPSVMSPLIKSNAERRVFEWFRDDPSTSNWVVLHSLGIANHNKVLYGETDFFILAPGLGLFALEVKGGRVRRENGIWYFTNKYGKVNSKARGPFEQAYDGAFSIVKNIQSKLDYNHKYLSNVFWGIGVMFPDIEYTVTGLDEEQWQVFDCNDGKDVGKYIRRLFAGAKQKWESRYGALDAGKLPTKDDIDYIASLLRGDFDKVVSVGLQLKYAEEALIELTREQYRCLDQLDDNPRCLIHGFAGTGKTLLAIEETKKAVAKGERVALFCFNSNLGDWLSSYFSGIPAEIQPLYIGTFHKFLIRILKEKNIPISFPQEEDELTGFYKVELPQAVKAAIENTADQFDKVIIDEAQDLILPQYLDIIGMCLKKGFERGSWTMFGDFSMQAIYAGNRSGEELRELLEERTAFIIYKLTLNCRNTKSICEEIQTVTGFKAPTKLWTKIEGPPVNYITYSNESEQRERLESLLLSLLEDGIKEENITILSPVKKEKSVVSLINRYEISDFRVSDKGKIRFCTIQAYKGLENMVVILTDIDSFKADKLMYVGLSRARSGLYIFESQNAQSEYLELQRRRFML